MMITRTFAYEQDEEYGFNGWKPKWMRNANSMDGLGVAHDVMEHIGDIDKSTGAENEFMALGAMIYTRGEAGYFGNFTDTITQFAYEFVQILPRIVHGSETLRNPGNTYKLRDYDEWDEGIKMIVNKGFRLTREEDDWTDLSKLSMGVEEAQRRIISWMRIGFRKARAFYYGRYRMDTATTAYLFERIRNEANKKLKFADFGMELTVKLDLRYCNAELYADYPDMNEDDY